LACRKWKLDKQEYWKFLKKVTKRFGKSKSCTYIYEIIERDKFFEILLSIQ
jgi:hypothetical protein